MDTRQAMKPIDIIFNEFGLKEANCPCCNKRITENKSNICYCCGQPIDWRRKKKHKFKKVIRKDRYFFYRTKVYR